jgi:hypothetical protein
MTANRADGRGLSTRERQFLGGLLVELHLTWSVGRLAELVVELPPEGPFRRLALIELIHVDLGRSWQLGWGVSLTNYLTRFPDLGDPDTVPAELILTEYEARRQFGPRQDALEEVLRRFPRRAEEVRRLIASRRRARGWPSGGECSRTSPR